MRSVGGFVVYLINSMPDWLQNCIALLVAVSVTLWWAILPRRLVTEQQARELEKGQFFVLADGYRAAGQEWGDRFASFVLRVHPDEIGTDWLFRYRVVRGHPLRALAMIARTGRGVAVKETNPGMVPGKE